MDFIGRGSENSADYSLVQDSSFGKHCHFTVKGRVSLNESSHLEAALVKAAEAGYTEIVIDMSLVSQLSSVGIRVLLSMHKRMKKINGRLRIENPSENVKNVIGMIALDELL